MVRQFVVNGKFLRAESTGVHRVATELANALAALDREGHPALDAMAFSVMRTRDGAARESTIDLPCREMRPLTGIPWEQFTLPLRKGNATLLSLCNIGPVAARADDAGIRTRPEHQEQRIDEDGLPGAGFAGEDAEALAELEAEAFDDHEILNLEG